MAAAFWVIRTSTGKLLNIEYNDSFKAGGFVYEQGHKNVFVRDGEPPVVVDNVAVSVVGHTMTVVVQDKWELAATIAPFPFGNLLNKNKNLLNININPLYNADADVVAPHGIIGQAYDGDNIGINGKSDSERGPETTTKAQASIHACACVNTIWHASAIVDVRSSGRACGPACRAAGLLARLPDS
eukprot:3186016-Pleurochrysis_carterae.AAC.2